MAVIDVGTFFIYLAIMAFTTYAVRVVPLVLCRGKIENVFIRSFLTYIPYAVLGAMTFPAILYSTRGMLSAVAGMVVAIVLAWRKKTLLTVAMAACLTVYVVEFLQTVF